jgi:signal transduction histidine kinase
VQCARGKIGSGLKRCSRGAPVASHEKYRFQNGTLNSNWSGQCESSRLNQGRRVPILTNLAGNAIKFTNEGEVAMKVEVKSQDGDDRTLHFIVSDTGIGIPLEKQL